MGPAKELRSSAKLEFGVFASVLLVLGGVNAGLQLQIKKTPSSIKALLGEMLTIPCVLTADDNQQLDLNLVTLGIRWKKIFDNGTEIDVYKYLNLQHEPIRPESFIDKTELRRGNASLTLHHVQISDEGEYTCTIFVTPYKLFAGFKLQLLAQPKVSLFTSELGNEEAINDIIESGSVKYPMELTIELGSERFVTCEVSKFYPNMVKIQWVRYNKISGKTSSLDKVTYFTVTEVNSDGTFNVSCLVIVKPSKLEETGDTYCCIVTHESFNNNKSARFTLTVEEKPNIIPMVIIAAVCVTVVLLCLAAAFCIYFRKTPPKISDIAGIYDLVHNKSSNLTWMVSGFKPKTIEINAYLKRGDNNLEKVICKALQAQNIEEVDNSKRTEEQELLRQHHAIQFPKPKSSFFSNSCIYTTNITPDKRKDKEAELLIEVKHAALNTTLQKFQKLNINGDIFTAHIIGPQCFEHGKEVTLTCEITKCDPKQLEITWMKGKQVIFMDGKTDDIRYRHSESRDVQHEGNVLKTSSCLTFKVLLKEDHGMKYTCRVQYPELNKILMPHLETFITVQPVVEKITSKDIGEQMELSCRIHSFYPETLEIKWFKEDELLPTTEWKLSTNEDGLYETTATLMYIPDIKDIGKIFRCEVDHQSLPNPKTCEWKLEELRKNYIKA